MAVSLPISRDPFTSNCCISSNYKSNRYYPDYPKNMPYNQYPTLWQQPPVSFNEFYSEDNSKSNHVKDLMYVSHLKYLKLEESPKKLEERKYLEHLIEQYVCNVPHANKFETKEIHNIFNECVCSHLEHSPSKTIRAWNALEKFANNLCIRPWRVEFREIKFYSGFYKHSLEAFSTACDRVLKLMGYVPVEPYSMVLTDDPDLKTMQKISLDCIIAIVEIQIMLQICEAARPVPLNWREIFSFRKQQVCNVDRACSDLISLKCQEVRNHRMAPYYSHCAPVQHYPPYPHPTNHPYALGPHELYPDRVDFSVPRSVPTGLLLDLELSPEDSKPVPPPRRAKQRPVENREELFRPSTFEEHMAASVSLVKESANIPSSLPSKESGSGESWEYVYKTLQSKGYKKDFGERGDVLSTSTNHYEDYACGPVSPQPRHTAVVPPRPDIAESFRKLTLQNMARLDDLLEKSRLLSAKCNDTYEDSSEDELAPTIPQETKSNSGKSQETRENYESRGRHKSSSSFRNQEESGLQNRWECVFCTYINHGHLSVCTMCSKSRAPGPEQQPLKSGGKECHHCTFVNSRNSMRCQVCSNDLENSPTYV